MSTWKTNPPRLQGPLRARVALSAFLVPALLSLVCLALALSWHGRLPDPVATHFGPRGEPNGWMSLNADYAINIVILLGLNALNLCIALSGMMRGKSGLASGAILSGSIGLTSTLLLTTLYIQLDGAEPNLGASGFLVGLIAAAVCAAVTALTFPVRATEPEKSDPASAERGPREPLRAGEKVAFFGAQSGCPVLITMVSALVLGSAILVAFASWWAVAVTLLVGIIAIPFLSYLRVRVDESGVAWAFGFGIPRGAVALRDIESAESIDINPLDFGGWGYRLRPNTLGLIVRGGPGIRVHRKTGRDIVISLAEPDEAVETLRQLLART